MSWKNIIKNGIVDITISKSNVKIKCANKDVGEEVSSAIRDNIMSLSSSNYEKLIKGANYKDFTVKFNDESVAREFWNNIMSVMSSDSTTSSTIIGRTTPSLSTPMTAVKTPAVPSSEIIVNTAVEDEDEDIDEDYIEPLEFSDEDPEVTEQGSETETSDKKKKIIVIAVIAVAVLLLGLLIFKMKKK